MTLMSDVGRLLSKTSTVRIGSDVIVHKPRKHHFSWGPRNLWSSLHHYRQLCAASTSRFGIK